MAWLLGCAEQPSPGPVVPSSSAGERSTEAPAEIEQTSASLTPVPASGTPVVQNDLLAGSTGQDQAAQTALPALCNSMCDRLTDTCSEESVEECRFNCTRFESIDARCQADARAALECATRAEDMLCIQVAPASCTAPFKQYNDCLANPALRRQAADSASGGLAEWRTIEDTQAHFRVSFPVEPARVSSGDVSTWRAELGTSHWVATTLDVSGAAAPQRLMRAATQVVGECPGGVRIHGQYETPDGVHVAFNANCPEGRSWFGAVHLFGTRAFVTAVQGPVDKAEAQRFFESFEHR